jgi:von Willebrand factor type A C-terminal domain/von Willebrand factor type A domain
MLELTAATFQNEHLPVGGTDVNAVISVTARGEPSADVEAAEIIIVDVSGSMLHPRSKLAAAKAAAEAAVDQIRDGVWFGLVAGTGHAHRLYPTGALLVRASAETRAEARAAIETLDAMGGTSIGRWLIEAYNWFAAYEGMIRHAILLTDGRNESETADYFSAVLDRCLGAFQCDCRGIGVDWSVAELRRIASALLGTVDIVAQPNDLPADFEAMMRHSMARREADVRVRVRLPRGATLGFFRQVSPTIEDLSARGSVCPDGAIEFTTGAWGQETREYHLCIAVPPHASGEEMLAGRVSVVVGDDVVATSLVRAVWTDDVGMSTRIHPRVAHYSAQEELANVIAAGLEAGEAGDEREATFRLGRAAQLAADLDHGDILRLLENVVDVDDAATGTVRLKRAVDPADEMALDTRSTKTVRLPPEE